MFAALAQLQAPAADVLLSLFGQPDGLMVSLDE